MKLLKATFIISLLIAVVVTGCSKNNNSTSASEPAKSTGDSGTSMSEPAPAKKVTITVQGQPPEQKEANIQLDKKIERFKSENPNVEIKKDDWQYNPQEIGIKMASNSAPTEFNAYATEGKVLADRKWAADVTDLINSWGHAQDINPILQKPFEVNGKQYGIPVDGYIMTITLNKKIFEDKGVPLPPLDWTWDDLIDAAKKVNDPAKGIAGFIPMGKGNEAGWNWTNFLFAAGGDIQKVENGKVIATFNSEAGLKALEFYKRLKDENLIPENWALGYGDALNAFNQGRGAMVMCGSGNAADAAINTGGLNKDDIVVYPIPSMTKGGKHTGVLGGSYKVINPQADKDQQQVAFKWLTSEYFTDTYLNAIDSEITSRKEKNQTYVPQLIQYFKDGSDFGKKWNDTLGKHDNVYTYDPALVGLLDGKPESQYETQNYYGEMANVVQKIFTTKDVDLKQTLQEASDKVQKEIYDKIKVD